MSQFTPYLSLQDILAGYRSGEISPVDITQAALDRIEEVNPKINAICHVDQGGALRSAAEAEQRWKRRCPLGMLDGVPTTVKDILPTAGMPGQYLGAAGELGCIAEADHPAVARMREAGAVILGKNTMCDYGIIAAGISSRYGITRNPWNLAKTPGASSSGAAASVAAGIEPVSIGTDIVGSIRLPASFCGLVGLKPSRGRVPYYFPNSPAVVAGPLARNVTDAAIHLTVLAQPDHRDFTALPPEACDYANELENFDPRGIRALLITDFGLGEPPARDTVAMVQKAARDLEAQGVEIQKLDEPRFTRFAYRPVETFYKMRYMAALNNLPEAQARQSPIVWEWTRAACDLGGLDYYQLTQECDLMREATARLIEGFDFLLMPTTPNPAFAAENPAPDPTEIFQPWANTFLFNITEQPAISVPCGLGADGLPIGLQIVGQRFDDMGVLRMARLYEQIRPGLGLPLGL